MLDFISGLMVGGAIGAVTMCLMTIANEADALSEEFKYEVIGVVAGKTENQGKLPK